MKKVTIFAAVLSLMFVSCKKDKCLPTPTTEPTPISFDGHWKQNNDTTRYIDVKKTSDSTVMITFPRKLDTPPSKQGTITLTYTMHISNDTVYCKSGNIYPAIQFINKKVFYQGFIAETTQGPELGTMREMHKD